MADVVPRTGPLSPELAVAIEAARRGGAIISRYFHGGVEMRAKAPADLVSDADVESEQAIAQCIHEQFPDHLVVGEELHRGDTFAEHAWIVDPLDGTNNFAHRLPQFAVSIAYCQRGEPVVAVVYNPITEDWYVAERGRGATHNGRPIHVSNHTQIAETMVVTGFILDPHGHLDATLGAIRTLFEQQVHGIRRFGSAALDLCGIACGRFGGYFEYELRPWDFAAGMLIVTEAGGRVTNCLSEPLTMRQSGVFATNGHLHTAIGTIIAAHLRAAKPLAPPRA